MEELQEGAFRQGAPGEAEEAGTRVRRVWLIAALGQEEGAHLCAFNAVQP